MDAVSMIVDEKYQKMGIGTQLMKFALEWISKKQEKLPIIIFISKHNPIKEILIKFYEKFDFIIEGINEKYINMIHFNQ